MALPLRPNNKAPIPNQPFSSPLNLYVSGPYFPVVMGAGIDINNENKVSSLNNDGVLDFSGITGAINLVPGPGVSVVETTGTDSTDFTISNTGVLELIAGGNISISGSNGSYTISATDAQTGTVTSVATGAGLTGGPITTSGTISLDSSGVTPGSYTYPSITVDAYGRLTVAANGTTPVTAITGSAPVQVTGTAPTLNIAVGAASTVAPGVVQLNDSTNSTSTTQALTANAGNVLQQQINALAVSSNITLAGTIDAATGFLVTVTTEGAANGFAVGSPLPAADPANDNYFTIVTVAGTMTPPGGSAQVCHVGDWWLSNGTIWQFLDVAAPAPVVASATPTTEGVVFGHTDNTTNYNTSLGYDALLAPTASGVANVALGFAAGNAVSNGYGNTLVGGGTGCALTDGTVNVAVGFGAFSGATTAFANAVFGICSGCAYTVESGNAILGGYYGDAGDTNTVTLSDGAGNLKAKFDSNGALSFNGTSYGTAGQVLSSNGPGAKPSWVAASAPVNATPTVRGTVYGCSGGNNTSVGCNALKSLTAGGSNTAFGLDALCSVTISTSNTAMGDSALSLSTGCQNTAVGAAAVYQNASGTCNSSFGHHSMVFSSGSCNSAFGLCSLRSVSGSSNVALGANTGSLLTSGNSNVLVGPSVQAASATGSCQLAIGFDNGQNWLTGDSTKAIKPGAGLIDCANSCGTAGQVLMSTGSNGVCWGSAGGGGTPVATPTVVGTLFGCSNSAGTLATAVGYNALAANPTGNWNVAVGSGAGQFLTTGQWNTFIGSFAGNIATTATGSVAIGINAAQLSNGSGSIAIGNSAGYRSGNDNVTIGNASMSSTCTCTARTVAIGSSTARFGSGNDNVTIGFGAACVPSCGGCNTVVGSGALQGVGITATTAPCNTSLGFKTLNAATTACLNVALGFATGCSITSGAQNVLIGPNVGATCTTEACTLAIGYSNTALWLTGDSTKAIKPGAGIIDCAGSCGTAGQVLMSNGLNAVCWGTAGGGGGGSPATPTVAGTVFGCTVTTACSTTLLGYNAGCALTSGTTNTFVGRNAGLSATTLNCSVLIGNNAGDSITAGQCAIIIGHNSGCSLTTAYGDHISIGTEAMATGTGISNIVIGNGAAYASGTSDSMVIIGHCAGEQGGSGNTLIGYESNRNPFGTTTGFRNTALGYQTLFNASSGAQNTAIGWRAGEALTTGSNNIILGNTASTAAVTSSNSVTLGNSSISVIRAQVTTITGLSDARDKTDVTALPVGLNFINSLNPVKFTWQMREPNEVKDGTSEAGFIAQDLQTAQGAAGADYLNLVYDENPDRLEASPGKLVPVLVKAIQELSAKVEDLEAKLAANG